MTANTIAGLIESTFLVAMGLYATLLGQRRVGKKPGESFEVDRWHDRNRGALRFGGPIVIALGVFRALQTLLIFR